MANETALSEFVRQCNILDRLLAEIKEASLNHFGTNPDEVHWGNVGDVKSYCDVLQNVSDCIYNRGEYANDR